jgi:hypothetical protein
MHRRIKGIAVITLSILLLSFTAGRAAHVAQAASSSLAVSESCQTGGSDILTFTWSGNDASAVQQWVDVSTSNNDWQPGTFIGNGPLSPAQTSIAWTGLSSSTYFVRVNQQLASGTWDPSPTFAVATGCGAIASAPSSMTNSQSPAYAMPGYGMPPQAPMAPSYVPYQPPAMMIAPNRGMMMGPYAMR